MARSLKVPGSPSSALQTTNFSQPEQAAAVEPRQAEVEHDGVEAVRGHRGSAGLAVPEPLDGEALAA